MGFYILPTSTTTTTLIFFMSMNLFILSGYSLRCKYKGKFQACYTRKGEPSKIRAIRGGVFSQNGHLYLVLDRAFWQKSKALVKFSGIYGFDTITGREAKHIEVDYEPTLDLAFKLVPNQELEGMDIWNLGSEWGQIHIMLNDNEPEHDDIFFKHFKANSGDEDKI